LIAGAGTRQRFGATAGFVGILAMVFAAILRLNDGVFTFALDDPYIHMAVARSIAHAHYGLNAVEAASPSSSIAYPLLLAPIVWLGPFATLLLAAVPACAFVWQLHAWLERERNLSAWHATAITALIAVGIDLVGLVFMGMETPLQIWLCFLVCRGMGRIVDSRLPGQAFWVAVIAGPMIRYEALALTVAALALDAWRTLRIGRDLVVLATALVPLVLFSVWLTASGLSWLPDSVLLKAVLYGSPAGGRIHAFVANGIGNLTTAPGALLAAATLAVVIGAARRDGPVAAGVVAIFVLIAQLVAGQLGWFGRYEAWSLLALMLLALIAWSPIRDRLDSMSRLGQAMVVGCLILLFAAPLRAAATTPAAAHGFYGQQLQMARIVRDLGIKRVAVGDVGLVAWSNPGVHVLDLTGLASHDVALRRQCCGVDSQWLQATAARHGVEMVMLYGEMVPEGVPGWGRLAQLTFAGRNVRLGGEVVTIYVTPLATDQAGLRRHLSAMVFPADVRVELHAGEEGSAITGEGDRTAVP
jgi:hypothetical protein